MNDVQWRHCHNCNSKRRDAKCAKCGSETSIPHPSWEYPALPPVDLIRSLAKEVGYAIGEHGTKERDLDLIAVPWTVDAVDVETLLNHLTKNLVFNGEPAIVVDREEKPLGRYAVNIQLNGWFEILDLSICPRISP